MATLTWGFLPGPPPPGVAVGVVLLAAAGALRPRSVYGMCLGLWGAWWVAWRGELPGAGWIPWFVLGLIVLAAPLVRNFDHQHAARAVTPTLLALAVLGLYLTVPDTEEARVVLGFALALALLSRHRRFSSLGGSGSYAAVGVLAWVMGVGGHGREGSMVGAAASLGLLVTEPLGRGLAHRERDAPYRLPQGARGWFLAALVQLTLVLYAARIAGMRETVFAAALMSLPVLGGAVALVALASGADPAPVRAKGMEDG